MPPKKLNKKDMAVVISWLRSEKTLADVGKHFQIFNGNLYNKLAIGLRQAYEEEKLILK